MMETAMRSPGGSLEDRFRGAPEWSGDKDLGRLCQTLPGRMLVFAKSWAQRVAFREKEWGIWREWSWEEVSNGVMSVALVLDELGIKAGDHVAILSDNRPEWLIADLAIQGLGARSVGIYQTNPSADVGYILQHSQSRVLFCEDQEQLDKILELGEETPALERVVIFDPRGTRGLQEPRLETWEGLLEKGRELLAARPRFFEERVLSLDPRAASMVVYTSGTTGPPKGAMISSYNVVEVADQTVGLFGLGEGDTLLSYLPLCHVAEKIFSQFLPLASGSVVHFGESIYTVQTDLKEVSPTVFLGVPRIWEKMHASVTVKIKDATWLKRTLFAWCQRQGERIARATLANERSSLDAVLWWGMDLLIFRPLQERLGLRSCRLAISGAAPISGDLLIWFHSIGVPIMEAFGQTECGGVSHLNLPGRTRIGSVGRALPLLECRIAQDGEILLRGPNVFVGYLHEPEITKETVDEDGWLHTGDVGEIDEDGFLRITGRKKEIIITSGGKNLSPEKIENALKMSPYVKEAIAIGDARKFVSALIQIESETVGDWATRSGVAHTSFEDLSAKPEVIRLIEREVDVANGLLARVEQVRAFRLLPKELNQDDGELTATQKVRRRVIMETFEDLIESMYTKTSGNGAGKAE